MANPSITHINAAKIVGKIYSVMHLTCPISGVNQASREHTSSWHTFCNEAQSPNQTQQFAFCTLLLARPFVYECYKSLIFILGNTVRGVLGVYRYTKKGNFSTWTFEFIGR